MTRVLVHGVSPNLGGIERYLMTLMTSVDRSEFSFDVTHSDVGRPPALRQELTDLGCSFYPVTPRASGALRNRGQLRELLATGRFDLLHFNATSASYLAPVRAALDAGIPVVAHSHSGGGHSSPRSRLLHAAGRASGVLRRTRNVAVSDAAGEWMFGHRSSWQVILNGFDGSAFEFDPTVRARTRQELDVTDRLVVGHVGAFLPAKNHEFLLRAFAELASRRPDAVLLLVGEGPGTQAARALSAANGLEQQVVFLGRRTDIRELLSAMDVFVLPSTYEGSPLAVAEARAAGLPTVVSEAVPVSMSGERAARLSLSLGPRPWAASIEQLSAGSDRRPLASGLPTPEEHALAMSEVYREVAGSAP